MTDLERLLALEQIRTLKARYCYHLDLKQWDSYAALFTQDASLDVDRTVSTQGRDPDPQPRLSGREAIKQAVAALLADADTVHQVHSPILEIQSAASAVGIWAMEDIVRMPGFHLEGRGHYRETYALENGAWRIASLHLTRTWLNIVDANVMPKVGY